MIKIIIGVTCYNNEHEVMNFIKGILNQELKKICVYVSITCIDQKSCDLVNGMLSNLNNTNKKVKTKVFNAKKNLGYMNACIYGIKKVLDEDNKVDWIIISNTDIEFTENCFFEKFTNIKCNKNIWCVGPAIIDNTKQYRNPYIKHRPSKKSLIIKKVIYSYSWLNNIYFNLYKLKKYMQDVKFGSLEHSDYTYAVHGCIFIISLSCFYELDKKATGIFMYGEENLIAEIVFKNRKKTYYWSESLVYHNNNQVTSNISDKNKMKWKKDSINYILRNFYE